MPYFSFFSVTILPLHSNFRKDLNLQITGLFVTEVAAGGASYNVLSFMWVHFPPYFPTL